MGSRILLIVIKKPPLLKKQPMKQLVAISNCMQAKGFSGENHIFIEISKKSQHKTRTNLHIYKKGLT